MTSPYYPQPQPPQNTPDSRPLYKRKRIWFGGFTAFTLGALVAASGHNDPAPVAAPTVRVTTTATATATATVTAKPKPATTVTKTAKPKPAPTVTVTETTDSGSGYSYDDSSGGTSGGGSTYYSNCSEARAAGAAPLYRGDPGYAAHLDRDGDGVACE
ncbi:excalibur calcium-binding domain-containing protein [Streptomyces sp. NPDC005917]|uniref:excalibur calcium-binding domain-containing protein n=1 Tax=unclassified Streptomyces TaxID=2593676 RepID=UPI0033CC54DA